MKRFFTTNWNYLFPEVSKSVENVKFPWNHEFRVSNDFTSEFSAYALRYEINRDIYEISDRFSFNVGAALNPYFIDIDYSPTVETVVYYEKLVAGVSLNVIPRLYIKLSDHFCIDVNLPLKIYDVWRAVDDIQNPSIPRKYQKHTDTKGDFFMNAYTARLAIVYKL